MAADAQHDAQPSVTRRPRGLLRAAVGWWSSRRWLAAGFIVVGAAVAMSYRGWHPTDDTWQSALEYPTRGAERSLARGDLSSAQVCGGCHTTHYEQWRSSAMSRSSELSQFLIQLYATSLELRGAPAEDVELCLQCHAPAALFGPEPDLELVETISREGVTCDICHTAVSALADASPGGLSWDPLGPKRGPLPGAGDAAPEGIARAVSSHHGTAYSALHESSELCGTCHMSLWPSNGLPIDWTYAEWARSPYAERGIQCQDCHMPTYTGVAAPGAPSRDNLHRHDFPGGANEAMVREAARVEVEVRSHFAGHEVSVAVENVGAGHAFPTGNASAPVATLELEAYDGAGERVFEDRREYRLIYVDASGAVTNDPTVAFKIQSDTTLQPLERRHERFYLAQRLGVMSVRVRLVYRRWGEHLDDHRSLAGEFLGRYLAQGLRVHRLLTNLGSLDPSLLEGVRGYAPIVVDEATIDL